MSTTKPYPAEAQLLTAGKTLSFNDYIRNGLINHNGASSTYSITAAGTNQATAVQLNSVFNEVDTVGSSTGVNLPNSGGTHAVPYQFCVIYNNGANALQVYAAQGTSDTINGTAGATGISMNAASAALFCSAQKGVWFSIGIAGNENFGAITVTSLNGLTVTTSTGTLTIPNGVTLTGPATSGTVATQAGAQTLTNKTLVDVINQDTVYGSAALTAVSTTTLAAVPGLNVVLTTSGTYSILAELPVTANAAGGVSIAAVASNSLTATSFQAVGKFTTASAVAAVSTTTLSGNVSATNATVLAELVGTIVVNTGGTLVIEAAQSVSTSATTTIAQGGFLQVTRIS